MATNSKSAIKTFSRFLAYIAALVLFVLGYHQLVHRAVSREHDLIAKVVDEYCKFAIAAQYRGPEHGPRDTALKEMVAEWDHCSDIRIESIAASGGIWNMVVVRVVLDRSHYLPLGKPVLVFEGIDYSLPFLSSLSRLATGQWTFNSHTVYSDRIFYGAI